MLKAYLRGAVISYSTVRKKEALREQLDSEKKLGDLDKQIKNDPSADATRSALNQLLTQKAESSIFYAKHRSFEMGDTLGQDGWTCQPHGWVE